MVISLRANLCFSGVSPAPRMHSYSQVTQGWACSSPKEHQIDHKCHMQLPVLTLPLRLPQWQKGKHQVHPETYGDQISLLRTCRATNPGSLQTHWTCISQWAGNPANFLQRGGRAGREEVNAGEINKAMAQSTSPCCQNRKPGLHPGHLIQLCSLPQSMSFEAHSLTVPAIRWLGLLPSDIKR